MQEINSITGESFEDMSISEMMNVQGSGDVNVETTPSPASYAATPAISAAGKASSAKCAKAASAISGALGSGALSAAKC